MSFTAPINKGKNIQCPAIRYLFYVIANTLQACNDFTRLNDEDILILTKAAIPNNDLSLNVGAVLARYLEFQSNVSQGPLTCGGVIDARVIAIRWEPQEEGMMSTAASFLSVRNQGLIDQ